MTRRLGALFVLSALSAALAGGQTMGEAAKKERERREKRRQSGSGPAPTVDADQLAGNKGTLANDTKQPPAGGARAAAENSAEPPQASAGDAEQYWRSRAAAARRHLEEMQRRYDALDRMIRFGQGGQRDENGVRRIYSQQDMKQMADSAEADLAAAKAALEALAEEGRRAGALPGWLR